MAGEVGHNRKRKKIEIEIEKIRAVLPEDWKYICIQNIFLYSC
jgi:hypothetical protein